MNNNNIIEYTFSIPANIKEIRPKVMDLVNSGEINAQKIATIFFREQKEAILNTAKKLLKAGVDIDIIEEVTMLSREEIIDIRES